MTDRKSTDSRSSWQRARDNMDPGWTTAKTFEDMRKLMIRVASNEIYSPFYPALIVGAEDNELIDMPQLRILKEINAAGLLTINSQEGFAQKVDGSLQRAYLIGYAKIGLAKALTARLNRVPGIAAFWHRNKLGNPGTDDPAIAHNLFVTYDRLKPFTSIQTGDDTARSLADYSPTLAWNIVHDDDIVVVNVIDTLPRNSLMQMVLAAIQSVPKTAGSLRPRMPVRRSAGRTTRRR